MEPETPAEDPLLRRFDELSDKLVTHVDRLSAIFSRHRLLRMAVMLIAVAVTVVASIYVWTQLFLPNDVETMVDRKLEQRWRSAAEEHLKVKEYSVTISNLATKAEVNAERVQTAMTQSQENMQSALEAKVKAVHLVDDAQEAASTYVDELRAATDKFIDQNPNVERMLSVWEKGGAAMAKEWKNDPQFLQGLWSGFIPDNSLILVDCQRSADGGSPLAIESCGCPQPLQSKGVLFDIGDMQASVKALIVSVAALCNGLQDDNARENCTNALKTVDTAQSRDSTSLSNYIVCGKTD